MRKAQKQDILNMIQTLHEAHEEIKSNINSNNIILAQDMLSQCQECAVSIGTAIEKLEGEGFVTVSLIETYCERLFSIYEELNGSDINANKIFKNLKKQLLRIENSIKNDIPIRKEVAFFPYKASMWDALESVYLAAKEDPNCDAYCVPIPYYDRNPDKSLGAMHYEGLEYPKNIEVVDWNTYNFEERKPDVIYIHNPYDDWNLVTCVHPRYFSNNLKKYTDKLVYIPYFILNEIEPDDQNSIDNMKHFIWTPGVINADKVIVQSEKMKQIYVNEYLKAAQANGLQGKHIDRKCLEEKFLGLGSPKIDKVLNTKKEDLEIPQEWLKIIEKPDGSWKKIILYNTSIGALLQHNEKMLEKMKYVFGVFKENKDEVALLWRPHPLIQSTVSSMRPQLWVEYEKLVRQYREEGWGIYDDSSDMDRAVVLSDAYYGDSSSVVQVYQKTGKLVMIQDCNQIKNNEKPWCRLLFDGGVVLENKIWCTHTVDSCIYTIDINTAEIDYVDRIVENKTGKRHFFGIVENANRLYLMPGILNLFAEYNPHTKEKKLYPYDNKKASNGFYGSTVIHGQQLYMFPLREKCILRFNMQTGKQSFIELPEVAQEDKIEFNKKGYFTKRNIIYNGQVILPCAYQNKILFFDLETERCTWKQINSNSKGFIDITKQGDEVFLLSQDMELYRSNIVLSGEIEKVMKLQEKYLFLIAAHNRCLLIPAYSSEIAVLNTADKKITYLEYPENIRFEMSLINRGLNNYTDIIESEDKMFLVPKVSNMLLSIDKSTGNIEYKEWALTSNIHKHLREYVASGEQMLSESELSFQFFLKCIQNNSEPIKVIDKELE